jgi:hypothetical protein
MRADPTDPNRVYFATNVTGTAYKGIRIINASTNATSNAGGSIVGTGQDVEVASDGTVHAIVNKKYFRSAVGGQSFVAVPSSSGLPQSGLSRLDIAVSPQDPNYVYAMATNSTNAGDILRGIYKSTDGGTTFTTICGPSLANSPDWMPVTQGFYCIDLAVHPLDKDVLIFGGLDVYRYTPQSGAKRISNWNYSAISSQYVHADIHRFDFDPTNPDNMYVLSDGGVNWTSNIRASEVNWVTKNKKFITTQCYSVCAKNYTGEILTGMQDNGNYFIDFTGNTSKFGRSRGEMEVMLRFQQLIRIYFLQNMSMDQLNVPQTMVIHSLISLIVISTLLQRHRVVGAVVMENRMMERPLFLSLSYGKISTKRIHSKDPSFS